MFTILSAHPIKERTAHLQYLLDQKNPAPHEQCQKPQSSTPRPPDNRTTKVKKAAKQTNLAPSTRNQYYSRPKPSRLSLIPKPSRDDTRPLVVLMGLRRRYQTYIRIRVRRDCSHTSAAIHTLPTIFIVPDSKNIPQHWDRLVITLATGPSTRQGNAI